MKPPTFLTVIAVIVSFCACNSQTLDDSAITAEIKAKLAADSQTSASLARQAWLRAPEIRR